MDGSYDGGEIVKAVVICEPTWLARMKRPIATGSQPISSTILRMISTGRLSRVGVIVCAGLVRHGGDTVLHRLYGRGEDLAGSFSSGITTVEVYIA